jgi:DNA primase small subunit
MPHSVSSASPNREDEELPDAPVESATETGGVKLEDMFNDDDDEEFPASSAQDVKMESSPAPAPARYAAHKSHRDLEIYDAE